MLFSFIVIPKWETSYLADEQFGKTELSRIIGSWSTILSLSVTLLITILLHYRSIERLKLAISDGARSSLLPLFKGLHPHAITLVAEMFKRLSKKRQIFIATQSPYLVDCFELENIIVASANNGETVLRNLPREHYQRWLDEEARLTGFGTRAVAGAEAASLMAALAPPPEALLAYREQRRRVEYTERGVAEINSVLL